MFFRGLDQVHVESKTPGTAPLPQRSHGRVGPDHAATCTSHSSVPASLTSSPPPARALLPAQQSPCVFSPPHSLLSYERSEEDRRRGKEKELFPQGTGKKRRGCSLWSLLLNPQALAWGSGLHHTHHTPLACGLGPASLACSHQQALRNKAFVPEPAASLTSQIHLLSAAHPPLLRIH